MPKPRITPEEKRKRRRTYIQGWRKKQRDGMQELNKVCTHCGKPFRSKAVTTTLCSDRCGKRVRYWKNRERHLAWSKNNRVRCNTNQAKWREANKEKVKAYAKIDRVRNRATFKAASAKRRAQLINATPKWADLSAIRRVYVQAVEHNKAYGIYGDRWEVDHIIPLVSPVVCGLHVHWNLRCVPTRLNRTKKNRVEQELARLGTYSGVLSRMTDDQLLEVINKTPAAET